MRKNRVFPLLMALGLCLLAPGCKKKAAQPSQEYFKARTMWIDLLREQRGKAYVAPEAEQVVELLRAVDPASLDAESAKDLLAEIQKGRAQARAEEEELQRQLERASKAGQADPSEVVFSNAPAGTAGAAGTATAAAAGGPDAGPTEPVVGMSQAELTRWYGRCFEYKNDAVGGGVAGGQVWGLKDLLGCRQDFPRFVSNSLLVVEDRVGAIRSTAELAPGKYKMVDGKLVPMTDDELKAASAPARAPAPAAEPARPPARNSADLTDVTPKTNQNVTDVTPTRNDTVTDVTPR